MARHLIMTDILWPIFSIKKRHFLEILIEKYDTFIVHVFHIRELS